MDREYVASSNIESIGYDKDNSILEVGFLNGTVYQYFDVPEEIWDAFREADSKGRFLNSKIKGNYSYSQV